MWEILNDDCLNVLDKDEYARRFDAVVADPPYCSGGFQPAQKYGKGAEKYSNLTGSLGNFNDGLSERALFRFTTEWASRACLNLKSPGYFFLFTDWRMLGVFSDALLSSGVRLRGCITWDKGRGKVRPQKGGFSQTAEYILWGTVDNGKTDQYIVESVFQVPTDQPKDRIHPTQKPVGIFEELYKVLPEGGAIIDPFAGSGSAGVAAIKNGFSYTGIEKDTRFADASKARLEAIGKATTAF